MIKADFHTHSSNSGDCDTPMNEQILSAINKNIDFLCITEHMDIDYPLPSEEFMDDYCDFNLDAKTYHDEYLKMKAKYEDSNPDFALYFGVEIGMQEHLTDKNNDFVKSQPFDFVIASAHLLNGLDPFYDNFWKGKTDSEVYREYFESIYKNICLFNNFDVLGHLDYIVRYGRTKDMNYSYSDYADIIDSILKKLIELGKGIEINTGGLKDGLKYTNPCPDIVKRYHDLGGEIITIGSDAHKPGFIAYEFSTAEKILKSAGFDHYNIFVNRKPVNINL